MTRNRYSENSSSPFTISNKRCLFLISSYCLLLFFFLISLTNASIQNTIEDITTVSNANTNNNNSENKTLFETTTMNSLKNKRNVKNREGSRKRKQSQINNEIETELIYVKSSFDGPVYGLMQTKNNLNNNLNHHINYSLIFNHIEDAFDYINHYQLEDTYSHRFTIILQQGLHQLDEPFLLIERPFTTILSENINKPYRTIIQANTIVGHLFFVHNTYNITLKGFTIQGGKLVHKLDSHPNVPKACGAGLIISDSKFINLEKVYFHDNKASTGGSICIYRSYFINFYKCEVRNSGAFINNVLLSNDLNNLQFSSASNFNVNQSVFVQNLPAYNDAEGTNGSGGGITLFNSNQTVFDSCVFINNTALNGGAIFTSNSVFNITNSRFSRNTAYNQSSCIYSDLNSEVSIFKVYFMENKCVRLSCKIIYSPKKELLDDIYSFKEYIFPIICLVGSLICFILFIIPIIELVNMISKRDIYKYVVWGDVIYLWFLKSLAIYRPHQTYYKILHFTHRGLIMFVITLSCFLQALQLIAVMPSFFDTVDTVRYIVNAIQQVLYNFIPLICYIALIIALNVSYKRIFVNYKPPTPNEEENEEEESKSLIKFYQEQMEKEAEKEDAYLNSSLNSSNSSQTPNENNLSSNLLNNDGTHTKSESKKKKKKKRGNHHFDWKKDSKKTGYQRDIHNRRALAACIISVLFTHCSYGVIIYNAYYSLVSNIDIAITTKQMLGLDSISSVIFYLLHWYLKITIMSYSLLTVYLLCNRINSYQNTFFSTLYHQLEKAIFNLQTGVYSYVYLRKESKRLVRYSWIITITYIFIFLALCANEVLMVLWGSSEYQFFIFYSIVMIIMLLVITHVSYTSNHWTSFRFDDFLAAVPHSIAYDYGIFFVPGQKQRKRESTVINSETIGKEEDEILLQKDKEEENNNEEDEAKINIKRRKDYGSTGKTYSRQPSFDFTQQPIHNHYPEHHNTKSEQLLRDLTFFHMYIRDRTFAYRFPLEIQMQTYLVITIIGLGGTAYALLKYLQSSFENSFYFQYL
ncbi:hypothetical protein ABK040_004770 [Willaertia magna]